MFIQFFYTLRHRKIPVSITEWIVLMEALSKGCALNSLNNFYYLARSILIKSESWYDEYDIAFQEYFKGIEAPSEIRDEVMRWLQDPSIQKVFSNMDPETLDKLSIEELMKEFEKRLKEQNEKHDGGSHWIGTRGTSPFGHSGVHPTGIRVGGKPGGSRAIKIAGERRFKNLRSDITLDIRQIELALKSLRVLGRIGPEDELDLDRTIDATAKNAGDIDLIWKKSRKNMVKLLLLIDIGGSMDEYASLCSRIFSAAHSATHFKDFQYYYFHNCVYNRLYTDVERNNWVNTDNLLKNLDSEYRVVIIGDARMANSELMSPYGSIYYDDYNETPGIVWFERIANRFNHCVWLNPANPYYWDHPTVNMVSRLFSIYELTLEGLTEGLKKLITK